MNNEKVEYYEEDVPHKVFDLIGVSSYNESPKEWKYVDAFKVDDQTVKIHIEIEFTNKFWPDFDKGKADEVVAGLKECAKSGNTIKKKFKKMTEEEYEAWKKKYDVKEWKNSDGTYSRLISVPMK